MQPRNHLTHRRGGGGPIWALCIAFLIWAMALVPGSASAQGGTGSVSGYAYLDINADGARQTGELALPNVSVIINPPGGDSVTRVTRSTDGYYSLGSLRAGRGYIIPALGSELLLNTGNGAGIIEFESAGTGNRRIDLPYVRRCSLIETKSIRWDTRVANCAYVRVCVYNRSPFNWGWIEFTKLPTGVTATPNPIQLTTPLGPGKGRVVEIKLTGVRPNTEVCFCMTFHSPDKTICCGQKICVRLPDAACFNDTQSLVECWPNNRHRYTFQYQNLNTTPIDQVCFVPKAPQTNVVFSPNTFTLSSSVPRGGTVGNTTYISGNGVTGNMRVCFDVVFKRRNPANPNLFIEVCRQTVCKWLPPCGECTTCPCPFIPGTPFYDRPNWLNQNNFFLTAKSFAGITCASPVGGWTGLNLPPVGGDFVFGVLQLRDYQNTPPIIGANWNPDAGALTMPGFHNENAGVETWTRKNMGQVFGLCIDRRGDVFVAQTSAYNGDGTDGEPVTDDIAVVWKVAKGSANLTQFVTFGQAEDPGIINKVLAPPNGNTPVDIEYDKVKADGTAWGSQRYPKLGDVCYSDDHDQIFVTNMGNGVITTYNAVTGTLVDTFDPMAPDASGDGFAPRGELLWAVQYHCGRLYYSVWVEDLEFVDPSANNYIRSVAILPTGKFDKPTDRAEVVMPALPVWHTWTGIGAPANFTQGTSAPISDIAFSANGDMMVAERGMGMEANGNSAGFTYARATNTTGFPAHRAFTNAFSHNSRGMLFRCVSGQWALQRDNTVHGDTLFSVAGVNRSSCGGVDWDRSVLANINYPATGRRVWFTADYMLGAGGTGSVPGNVWYGIQGMQVTGGSVTNSIIVDFNNVNGTQDKTTPGDVEFFGSPATGPIRP